MDKEKTAIYCRIDSCGSEEVAEQAIQIQRFKLEHYTKNKNLHVAGYYEDIGYPGNDLNRPGLQKLLSDYHNGKFKFVLVINVDRLFRGLSRKKEIFPFHIKSLIRW